MKIQVANLVSLIYAVTTTLILYISKNCFINFRLTDLTWSSDGQLLVVSSTDGYCSVIKFFDGELGIPIISDALSEKPSCDTEVSLHNKENINIKDTTPNKKLLTPKSKNASAKKNATLSSKKNDADDVVVIDEGAMEAWSNKDQIESPVKGKIIETPVIKEDSLKVDPESNEIVIDESTEDIKLVYEETETEPTKNAEKNSPGVPMEVDALKPPLKTPRRVNFITLSSPKNKKKH